MMRGVALLTSATAASAYLPDFHCPHGIPAWRQPSSTALDGAWLTNATLRERALEVTPIMPDVVQVDLDLPPEERWLAVGQRYANVSYVIEDYFEEFLPKV